MNKGLYRIGDFSKETGLSIRTLRYYDEIGLLKPALVDNYTNYRYYTEEDLADVETINFLKSVDFSLDEIIGCKDNLTSDILHQKQDEIMRRMEELQTKYDEIEVVRKRIKGKTLTLYKK